MNFSHDKEPGKNVTGIVVVIVLHAIVAYGIISGLGKRMVTKMAEAVETKIIDEVKPPPPKEVPPPPPPPEMKAPPPPFIPPVEVNVQQPAPVTNTISQSTNVRPQSTELARPQAPVAAAPAKTGIHIPAVADFSTCAKPEWPKASLRNEETGTVTLRFLIATDGRVVESQVVKSSGFRDLDRAAQSGIGKCRFKPGMTDGKPEQAWMQMQYVWTLE